MTGFDIRALLRGGELGLTGGCGGPIAGRTPAYHPYTSKPSPTHPNTHKARQDAVLTGMYTSMICPGELYELLSYDIFMGPSLTTPAVYCSRRRAVEHTRP